jgi:hypothetical protein
LPHLQVRRPDQGGPEGPSERKRTVRTGNTGRISAISGARGRFRSEFSLDWLFAACNDCVQSVLHAISPFGSVYCTQ